MTIQKIFDKYRAFRSIHIFGSRAIGNYKPGSDIDLVIMNESPSDREMIRIKNDFNDSSLPYAIDLITYTDLKHRELKEHIERVGVPFYQKNPVVTDK